MKTSRTRRLGRALAVLALIGASTAAAQLTPASAATPALQSIVPVPVSVTPAAGVTFPLVATTKIVTEAGSAPARQVGDYLAGVLRPSTGFALPVSDTPASVPSDSIALLLSGAPASVGAQGYQLVSTAASVTVRAATADGLFAGVQTLRQLLPGRVESPTAQQGPWSIPGATIVDYPRFAYRGAMLDVARHFHPVSTVKRYLDQLAQYKINNLHLHLADDQGWRIQIDSWPRLTTYGGSTQVGGGAGGYYTKAQYADIVDYAASRHITIIPEIDMPGHVNAALASYAELNCNGVAPALRTDTAVGYSSLCISKDITYTFVADVLRELAAMTPGPYLHIGGDEASATSQADYVTFMNKVLPLVAATGKSVVGWHDIAKASLPASATPQFWGTTTSDSGVSTAVSRGSKVILSPANKAYLDMKYNSSTPIGLSWAGYIEVQDAYGWNPGSYLSGVGEAAVRGVESPLWTETVVKPADIDYLAFPRLAAHAELGWSPWSTHDWTAFRTRLGAQAPRWVAQSINFYRSTQVTWDDGGTTNPGTCTDPEWSASQVYTGGNVVAHNGHKWTAKWWTQGEEPGTTGQWGVWTDNGAC
ncbi:family 20 glycosylhydrolase [Amycolatopsis vancoresmycina]|uniref:beta-N-acetylhexosaminidase n=1 Tax=Amycolatopsis vancoresmycina DSM 44592 TaxID=1292037 RepID=R1HS69_9PSEU|nr:family 20 glycosylhydrolase [Amycolatopsis vancoresmycina]EOD66400.1 beta-N-acetylhexosaminidase [Amycolatopsis vancoresmycina DSM 44592]